MRSLVLFHPDYTVGTGITPVQLTLADYTAGRGSHPALKTSMQFSAARIIAPGAAVVKRVFYAAVFALSGMAKPCITPPFSAAHTSPPMTVPLQMRSVA